ncbi:hypothetical protein SEA_SHROOMS_60 [Arthrobacter phage Shrooms]|nr:hypothetical protein SEA_SHROOMS_60 [Arthrobacter phage Shrooms]
MAGQYPGKGVHAQYRDYGLRGLRARTEEYRLDYHRIAQATDATDANKERAAARWASYADLLETVERLRPDDVVRARTDGKAYPE